MKSFFIPNHSSNALRSSPFLEVTKLPKRPDFPTKAAMLEWAHAAETEHCFYNFSEPNDPAIRCTKENPVKFLHGLVADFDTVIERPMLLKALGKMPVDFPAAWASETFSKGCRIIWAFEKPVPVFSQQLAKDFLARAAKDMKLTKLLPGFDAGAFVDPARYFELGSEWLPVNALAFIPATTTAHWMFEVSSKANFSDQGTSIPIDVVAAEVERRWPGRWQGPFTVGAQGVRFWDSSATNPKGAWIRETGVQAFTGEGRFLHWGEVLGQDFVNTFERERIGGATQDIYFDGKSYWTRNALGYWVPNAAEVLRRQLRAAGLRAEGRRGEMPEIDRAMHQVEKNQRIDGVFPFLYSDKVVHTVLENNYLNVSRVRPLRPADGRHEWGEGFPWIAKYYDTILDQRQREVMLSWLAHAYQGALEQKPRRGQVVFFAGEAGVGKTFQSLRIVAPLFGGYQEATRYLTGQTEFNRQLFESAYWTVDDAEAAADGKAHELYSQVVKKIAANPSMTYRAMYRDPVTLPWQGRCMVTLNSDPKSIAMLPNVEQSMLDKVLFILANKCDIDFSKADETVPNELPAFAAFLRDWKLPASLKEDWRYGFSAIGTHHPELLQSAIHSSTSSAVLELVTSWRDQYFRANELPEWVGTSTELFKDILENESLARVASKTISSSRTLARDLGALIQQRACNWLTVEPGRTSGGRLYKITRT